MSQYDDNVLASLPDAAPEPQTQPDLVTTQQAPASKYDDSVLASLPSAAEQLHGVLDQAVATDPDKFAKAQTIADNYKVPSGPVYRMLDEWTRREKVDTAYQLATGGALDEGPLAKTLRENPDIARMSHDDIGNIVETESWFKSAGSLLGASAKSGVYASLSAGARIVQEAGSLAGVLTTPAEMAVLFQDHPEQLQHELDTNPALYLERVAQAADIKSAAAMDTVSPGARLAYGGKKYATLDPSEAAYLSPVKLLADTLRSMPTTAVLAATIYLTRGAALEAYGTEIAAGATAQEATAVALRVAAAKASKVGAWSEGAIGGAQQYDQTLQDAMKADMSKSARYAELQTQGYSDLAAKTIVDQEVATHASIIAGTVDAVTNRIGGQYLGRIIGEGGQLVPRMVKAAATEATQEFFQSMGEQLGQNWAEQVGIDPDKDLWANVIESGLQGLFVGGLTGGAITGAVGRVGEHNRDVVDGTVNGTNLGAAFKALNNSALLDRSPVQFRALMQSMADNSPESAQHIYVDGEVLHQLIPDVQALLPDSVRQQIQGAVAIGATVSIPIADALTVAPGTPLEQVLAQHARTMREDGSLTMSPAEAKDAATQASEFIQAETERVMSETNAAAEVQQSADTVRTSILTDLQATNRYRPAVNELLADYATAMYSATAQRNGMLPHELYGEKRMVVSGEAGSAGTNGQPPIVQFRQDASAIEARLPPVAEGMTRLWRGNRTGETGQNPQFTNDLPGIALPFRKFYGGDLSYVDVPNADAAQYLNHGAAAPGAEFILPNDVAAGAKPVDLTDANILHQEDKVKNRSRAITQLLRNLTPQERSKITDTSAAAIIRQLSKLPSAREMAAVALGGKAKLGWYKQSAEAISAVFGADGPRFAALLAAMSPQTSVENNLLNALNVWKNWELAQRPTSRAAILKIMGESVQGNKGEDSVLGAWIPNAMRALSGDPTSILSGPKVNSFFHNLVGDAQEVTNDAWMANYALVNQTIFSGSLNIKGTDPGKGSGYLAMSARVREAARFLTKATGRAWSPAEVQETIWSWAKTLYEMQGDKTATEILNDNALTDDLINSTPDFGSLFHDPVYAKILQDAGYGKELESLQGAVGANAGQVSQATDTGGETAGFTGEDQRRLRLQAARRLEQLRTLRAQEALNERRNTQGTGRQQAQTPGLQEPAGVRGSVGVLEQSPGSNAVDDRPPLEGLPATVEVDGKPVTFAPFVKARQVAVEYMRKAGLPYQPPTRYAKLSKVRATRIALAFEAMQHAPQDAKVKASYDAMIQETLAQWQEIKATGLVVEFNKGGDPYGNPRNAMLDVVNNNHLFVFATSDGFGTDATFDPTDNPLLAAVPNEVIDGREVLANDIFRIVHDYMGHIKEGVGFRAEGEENAWQSHASMYSDLARGAMTTETRGQNSWLNYGPYGEANRSATTDETHFADQKIGLLPDWAMTDGYLGGDAAAQTLQQNTTNPLGSFNPQTLEMVLGPDANLSTFFHETGHVFLELLDHLASQPNAPEQVRQDFQTFLDWANTTAEEWQAWRTEYNTTGVIPKGMKLAHEQWAESVEQYVMTGKAPSVELAPLFRRAMVWMKSVYRSLKNFLALHPATDQKLDPDIRKVMDRMLATDEQIAQAEEVAGMVPDEEATGEAMERLSKRSIADLKWSIAARSKAIQQIQKGAATIRAQIRAVVATEVAQEPIYQADQFIRLGKLNTDTEPTNRTRENTKLNLDAVKEILPQQLWSLISTGKLGLAANDGIHPNMVADIFGFPSGDVLVRELFAAEPMEQKIDGITDQRMLEEHGDLIDDRAIREAANAAVHNESRAKSLATELRTQTEMLGERTDTGRVNVKGRPITVSTLVEAAKQFGANIANRTTLKDLRGASWKHTMAERAAAKRGREATMAARTQDAVNATREQVLNNAAARALIDARDESVKILKFFKQVTTGSNEKVVEKGRDPDIVNAARAILGAYGMSTPTTRNASAYMTIVAQNDPDVAAHLKGSFDAALANAQPMAALTFEELQELHENIQALWIVAKSSRQMEVDGNKLDIEDAADELHARMEARGIPPTIPGEESAITEGDKRAALLQTFGAWLNRVEQWTGRMDGAYGGPFLRLIFQPIKTAADLYRNDALTYQRKLSALIEAVEPHLSTAEIAAPELRYTFGRGVAGGGMAELLHAVLHTGNASNQRKLLLGGRGDGRAWGTLNPDGTLNTARWDGFIHRLITDGTFQKVHMDFVQSVWNLLEETKPAAQKTHREVFGRYFDEVTAHPVTTPWGVYKGGYLPAQADPTLVHDAALRALVEEENARMVTSFPNTPKGFTQSRVESYTKPLLLNLLTLSQHINKVLLFTHMTTPTRGAARLIKEKSVSQPLSRIAPKAIEGMLTPWLNTSARQSVDAPVPGDGGMGRALTLARTRAGLAMLMGNTINVAQQISGIATMKGYLITNSPNSGTSGTGHILRAVAQFIAHPSQQREGVWHLSSYMRNRALSEVAVLRGSMEKILLNPSLYRSAQEWTAQHAFFLQNALDNRLSPLLWTAAYNHGLTDMKLNEIEAQRFADGAIRQTQGSSLPEDVSRIETGNAITRLLTQFYGYFNMLAQTNATGVSQVAQQMGLRKGAGKAFYLTLVGTLGTLWIAEAVTQLLRGGPPHKDDDNYLLEWIAAVFGWGSFKGITAMAPGGTLVNAMVGSLTSNPSDDKVSVAPVVGLLEGVGRTPGDIYKTIEGTANAQHTIKDVSTLLTLMTGLPFALVARPLGYVAGVSQGKIEPANPVDAVRGAVTGTTPATRH